MKNSSLPLVFILLLALGFTSLRAAAPSPAPAVNAAKSPATSARATAPAESSDQEVMKATPFTTDERKVLANLRTMPLERLLILLQVYEKKDNTSMMDALIGAILQRDPTNARALAARELVNPKEELRRVGYLDALAAKVMAGEKVEDAESIAVQAAALCIDSRAPEAVALLEKLRANQYNKPDDWFEYLDDLAYAYAEAEIFDKAETAYNAVIKDQRYPADIRQEAQQALPDLSIKKRIASIRHNAGSDMNALIAGAAALHSEMPQNYEVINFRIEALDRARRYDDAIAFIQSLRSTNDTHPWPYLPTLAYAYYGAKKYDQAITTFREIHATPGYDQANKLEAETMILEIQVGREIETGMAALNRSDTSAATTILGNLETNYKTHRDVLGYKAIYLAKQGQSDQALALLFTQKAIDNAAGLPFSQQDALIDVYLERKEFRNARAATYEIINDRRYDEEMRLSGEQKLQDVRVAELLEEGYRHMQNADRGYARNIADELARIGPTRLDVRIFQAEILLAYQHAKQARDELLALKPLFPAQPFPGQGSLAASLAQSGDLAGGYAAFGEVITTPGYSADDHFEAIWQRRALSPLIRRTSTFDIAATKEEEGTLISTQGTFATSWHNDWRFGAFTRSDFSNLAADSLFGERSEARFEGGITATRRFRDGYYVEASLGASGSGALYGLEVGQQGYQTLSWSLGFSGNGRATDSLSLQALDGREDKAYFHIGGPLNERIIANLDASYNWTRVGGSKLGQGFSINADIDYIIQTETRQRPEISLGYFGEYRRFNSVTSLPASVRDQIRQAELNPREQVRKAVGANEELRRASPADFGREVFATLADPQTNRHGFDLKFRKHFGETWSGFIQAGAYYSFDDDTPAWIAATGFEYYLSENTMFYAELRYDSNGQGANTGSGVWEANLGGQMNF